MNFLPIVDPEIWQRYPEYRALSVVVRDFQPADSAAIPILPLQPPVWMMEHLEAWRGAFRAFGANPKKTDRKSTRLNSSHLGISYGVFCFKKTDTTTIPDDDVQPSAAGWRASRGVAAV